MNEIDKLFLSIIVIDFISHRCQIFLLDELRKFEFSCHWVSGRDLVCIRAAYLYHQNNEMCASHVEVALREEDL